MASEEIVKPVKELEKGLSVEEKTVVERGSTVAPNKEHFEKLVHQQSTTVPQEATARTSLMDAVRDQQSKTNIIQGSRNNLVEQTQNTIKQIEEIKYILNTPNTQIKRSAQQLLHSKLKHIDESLRIALSKVGLDYVPNVTPAEVGKANPITRFLHLLTDGQWQLQRLGSELDTMAENGRELSPVNMLAIQVKVNQIQQELELFTSLLSKGLESIKTIMNIQV